MSDAEGKTRMVFCPQICLCDAGDKHTAKYEQNLKLGKGGMSGIWPPPSTR
jgi:hypothetical protein